MDRTIEERCAIADADGEVESKRQEKGTEIAEAPSDRRAVHRVEPTMSPTLRSSLRIAVSQSELLPLRSL